MQFFAIIRPIRIDLLKNLRYLCYSNRILSQSTQKLQYYVVIKGIIPGLYTSWSECEKQVTKFSKARYRKFNKEEDVLMYLKEEIGLLRESGVPRETNSINILENILNVYKTRWKDLVVTPKEIEEEIMPTKCTVEETTLSSTLSTTTVNEDTLTFDEDGYLVIYTDGACSNNGSSNAVAGIGVYFGPESALNISMLLDGKNTNNIAEIQAATMGLRKAKEAGYTKVRVMTDSAFLIFCSTLWIKKWKNNGWKKYNGNDVVNREELIALDEVLSGLDVKWEHVPGHQGIKGNDEADRLARSSIQKFKEGLQ